MVPKTIYNYWVYKPTNITGALLCMVSKKFTRRSKIAHSPSIVTPGISPFIDSPTIFPWKYPLNAMIIPWKCPKTLSNPIEIFNFPSNCPLEIQKIHQKSLLMVPCSTSISRPSHPTGKSKSQQIPICWWFQHLHFGLIILLVLNVGNGWVAGGCWDDYW